jgi:hypothetical protein
MKFDNNTILFLLLGIIGMITIICITMLVYKHGAAIDLKTLVLLAILSQIPMAVVATLAIIIKKIPNENKIE